MKQAQSEMSQSAARLDLRRALERFQRLLVLFRKFLRAAEAKQGFSLKGIESNDSWYASIAFRQCQALLAL
jgi:predicted nucleic acid-binding protein